MILGLVMMSCEKECMDASATNYMEQGECVYPVDNGNGNDTVIVDPVDTTTTTCQTAYGPTVAVEYTIAGNDTTLSEVNVNGTIYTTLVPVTVGNSGMYEFLVGESASGCDSIVRVNLDLYRNEVVSVDGNWDLKVRFGATTYETSSLTDANLNDPFTNSLNAGLTIELIWTGSTDLVNATVEFNSDMHVETVDNVNATNGDIVISFVTENVSNNTKLRILSLNTVNKVKIN